MRVVASVCVIAFMCFPVIAFSQISIGLGGAYTKLPENRNASINLVPDGESFTGPYIWLTGSQKAGFDIGFSVGGYSLEKWLSVYTTRLSLKWEAVHYNLCVIYRTPLGKDDKGPLLSIRAGGTYIPIKVTGKLQYGSSIENLSDSENKIGPYLGANILIPIENSSFSIFIIAEKSFVDYELGNESINLGAFTLGAGLTYTFQEKSKN